MTMFVISSSLLIFLAKIRIFNLGSSSFTHWYPIHPRSKQRVVNKSRLRINYNSTYICTANFCLLKITAIYICVLNAKSCKAKKSHFRPIWYDDYMSIMTISEKKNFGPNSMQKWPHWPILVFKFSFEAKSNNITFLTY